MFGGWRGLRLIRSGLANQGCVGLLYLEPHLLDCRLASRSGRRRIMESKPNVDGLIGQNLHLVLWLVN